MSVFGVIVAIIKAIPAVEQLFSQLMATYIAAQNNETQRLIIDAASLSASAKTEEEREKALDAWQTALQRKRIE